MSTHHKGNSKLVTIGLPPKIATQVRRLAADYGVPMAAVCRSLILRSVGCETPLTVKDFRQPHVSHVVSIGNVALVSCSKNRVAIIDQEDAEKVNKYNWSGLAYPQSHITVAERQHKCVSLHNLILPPRDGFQVDHINGNTYDCRKCNLRYATARQNSHNSKKTVITERSPYKGVRLIDLQDRWEAYITTDGDTKKLGRFKTPIAAAKAYDNAARRIHGEFARLNFPNENEQPAIAVPESSAA